MIVKLCLLVLLAISSINAPGDRLDAESADDKIFLHYGSRSKPDSTRTAKDDSRRGRSTSTHRDYVSMPANSCFSSNLSTAAVGDRKSTRLNSSHVAISYAVFCLTKQKQTHDDER